ncbi:MAG: ATP-binding protein [Phycisphaerales bacterium]
MPISNISSVIDAVIVAATGAATSWLIWLRWQSIPLEAMLAWGAAAILILLVGRRLDRRARGVDAILSSIRAYARGVEHNAALRVSDHFGPLAAAYNRLLEDRDATLAQGLDAQLDRLTRQDAVGPLGLQSAIDSMWYGVVIVGPTGEVVALNGAARVLLGLGEQTPSQLDTAALFPEGDFDQRVLALATGRARKSETMTIARQTGDERLDLKLSARPICHDARGAVVIVEDITSHRIADEARAALTAHTVHELRTPLTNIRLYIEEALESSPEDTETRGRALNVINHEARRLERVVTDMLSAAEFDAGALTVQRGDVRLSQMFSELENDYKALSEEKRIGLTFDLPPKLPVITGDRDKLSMLVHNLIGNALKYTPEGGAVLVRFEELDDRYIVAVSDTGIGIAPEEIDRIFDRFYRARDARVESITGTGLGLTLAREVARLHGGDITVESKIDQGTTFTLWLPKEERAAAAA